MTEDGLLEQINGKLTTISQVQQGIPQQIESMKNDMACIAETAANAAIARHKAGCSARLNFGKVADRAAENTGILEGLRRRSIAPAARVVNAHPWLKILIPLLAIVGALLGVDLSGAL